jgi:GMP synthase (glutamine-hydrolysing)
MTAEIPTALAAAEEHEQLFPATRVAVLDAGGQYVDLVHKAVERQGIPAEVLPLDTPREDLEATYGAIIISGSPASSGTEAAPRPDPTLWESALPVLGICYGMQAMATAHGAQVTKNAIREDGRVTTTVDTTHPLFKGNKTDFVGLFTHGDFVKEVPEGFTAIGQHTLSDGAVVYSAIAQGNKVGVQFHPEMFDDTPEGYQLFSNFLHGIAELAVDESFQEARLDAVINKKRQEIAQQVGDRHVIAFVSGGVDSSVAATLAAGAIPKERLHCFYIDNGFMRDEDETVINTLRTAGIPVQKVDATRQFEQATAVIDGRAVGPLVTTIDPEAKRKIIGKTFIDVQNDILAKLELPEALLLQGTNAADRIESGHSKGGTHTQTIKTHHNQVTEVQELKARGMLVEPLDDLFKDEIRALGHELGLPHDLVERQPFPGPGLAIRIIGAPEHQAVLKPDPVEDDIRDFIAARGQVFGKNVLAHVLPIRSVGVGGDERSHISVVALDHDADLTAGQLAALASEIPAHFRGKVNRVIYALGEQALAKRTVTETFLSGAPRYQVRHADRIVFEAMRSFKVLSSIKQMPVVVLPLSFRGRWDRSIVLRPVTTSTFMTVQAMLPERDLPREFFDTITNRILSEVVGISQVFLDLTNKPPGTTEWE